MSTNKKNYLFTSRVGDRGTPGQDFGPGLGRDSRCTDCPGSELPSRCGNSCYHRSCFCGRRDYHDGYVEIPDIVRETIKEIGYTRAKYGFDYETCSVITSIHNQSPDIAMGVDTGVLATRV
jgi:S-adenosylmethionine synthetase